MLEVRLTKILKGGLLSYPSLHRQRINICLPKIILRTSDRWEVYCTQDWTIVTAIECTLLKPFMIVSIGRIKFIMTYSSNIRSCCTNLEITNTQMTLISYRRHHYHFSMRKVHACLQCVINTWFNSLSLVLTNLIKSRGSNEMVTNINMQHSSH